MAIDLKNVNISLNEFQRISSGRYNAGEVKLRDAKMIEQPPQQPQAQPVANP